MRTIAVCAAIVALALVILGFVLEAVGWLVVVGLVLLAIAVVAGGIGVWRARQLAQDNRSRA